MATAVSMDELQKAVVSILQASGTAYGSGSTGDAPDGSNQQYASSYEIDDRILDVDGEVCTAICQTIGHPYAPQFSTETTALTNGASITKNVGVVQKVTCYNGLGTETFTSANVNTSADTATITGTNLVTGTKVQLTTSGALPTGLSLATDYWIIRVDSNTIKFASSLFNAAYGTAIDLTAVGSGTNTITPQYVDGIPASSKEEIIEALQTPSTFGSLPAYVTGFYFVEPNNIVWTTSPTCKVTYTDYTRTSSPQAPESYTTAIIAGTVGKLLKDGGDADMSSYYLNIYNQMLMEIRSGAKVLPEILTK